MLPASGLSAGVTYDILNSEEASKLLSKTKHLCKLVENCPPVYTCKDKVILIAAVIHVVAWKFLIQVRCLYKVQLSAVFPLSAASKILDSFGYYCYYHG